MFDKALEVIGYADLISPLWALICDLRYGEPFRIHVPMSCTIYTTMLPEKGIRVWGAQIVDKTCTFTVRKPQAKYALYWLHRWGVPVEGHQRLSNEERRGWLAGPLAW